ncbi:ATP-dependent Clp protease proteolytic subunit [Candidatus Saccharibacteria bacterium]|nr:ATP-dependent Clp protease proteolytic subunit [Candidatus Saccharibacteria bacterium]
MDRRIYLTSEIKSADCECDEFCRSPIMQMVGDIMEINRYDEEHGIPLEDRKPIRLYINSPGGEINEGFALVSTIEISKTPIWTINIGMWASMAFLIGISGHRRFSLPNMTFLMHDGTNFAWDSGNKAQDKMKFDDRFSSEVIKAHVLKHSSMTDVEYDGLARVEYYMLPKDALKQGFIDEIVEDINTIL